MGQTSLTEAAQVTSEPFSAFASQCLNVLLDFFASILSVPETEFYAQFKNTIASLFWS